MPTHKYFILLISDQDRGYWHDLLNEAISDLGKIDFRKNKGILYKSDYGTYDLIIIDVKDFNKAINLTLKLRAKYSFLRIIIVVGIPTWRRVRKMFLSGAADYLVNSINKEKIRDQIVNIINNPPPIFPVQEKINE